MLIPVVPAPAFEAEAGSAPAISSDLVSTFAIAGPVFLQLPQDATHDAASVPFYKTLLRNGACHVGPLPLDALDAAAAWLDSGAATVAFQGAADDGSRRLPAEVAAACEEFPAGRVSVQLPVAAFSAEEVEAVSAWMDAVSLVAGAGFFLTPTADAASWATIDSDSARRLRKDSTGKDRAVSLDGPWTADQVAAFHRLTLASRAVCCVGAATSAAPGEEPLEAVAPWPMESEMLCMAECFALCARTDRADGLYTTVVTDERGMALGLVYSSKESIVEAIRSRRGLYYSRSRGGLWRKGDTSGAIQLLQRAALDCDSDAVLFSVIQLGSPPAFCHLNTRTCWGESGGLDHLQRVLAGRRRDAPPGSYTKRLFDDAALLRAKLVEEAQELSEAVEPDHVAAEAADVMYFAMVKCAAMGVSLADVERHLDRRALKIKRRPGNAKPERIAAADALLAKK